MNIDTPYVRLLCSTILASLLTACGGGGGGGGGGDDEDPATVSGSAVKGIIRQGTVTATELGANGAALREVGSATTDNNGEYNITLSDDYDGGPIQITITPGANTKMVCDVKPACGDVAFGGEVALPDDFALKALVSAAEDGDQIDVNVTPFTNMAAENALAGGALDAAAVNKANSAVNSLLGGIDILATKPINLAEDGEHTAVEEAYALLAAAIGQMAYEGDGDITTAIDALAAAWADTDSDGFPEIVATAAEGTMSLEALVQKADEQRVANDLADDAGVLSSLELAVSNVGEDGKIEGMPNDNAGDTDVAKAKSLVADIRTMTGEIADLEQPLTSLKDSAPQMGAVVEFVDGTLKGALEHSMELMLEAFFAGGGETGTFPYSVDSGTQGDVVVSKSSGKYTLALDGTVDGQTSDVTLTIPTFEGAIKTVSATLVGTITNSVEAKKLKISEGKVTVNLNKSTTVDSEDETVYPTSATMDFAFELGEIFSANETGIYFTGDALIKIGNAGTDTDSLYPQDVALTGTFDDGNNEGEVVVKMTVKNASTEPSTTLSIATTLTLSGQEPISVTLTLSGVGSLDDENAFDGGQGSLKLSYQGRTLTISMDSDDLDEDGEPLLTLSVSDGTSTLSVKLEPGDEGADEGVVTVDDEVVATITELSNGLVKVSYADGTFEIM